jgi:murein DD-endopeptidase MepM/ murein hydrolase activator NlpD
MSLTFVCAVPSYAKTKASIKQELAESQQDEKDAKAEYEAKKKAEDAIKAEIATLGKRIEANETALKTLEKKIEKNNNKIEETEVQLAAMEVEVEQQNDDLNARLRMMYESGEGTMIEVLLGSEDLNDFLGGLDIVKKIHEYDMQVLDEMNVRLAKIEEKKLELEDMKRLLKSNKKAQIEKRKALAEDKKKLAAAEAKAHQETEDALEDLEAAQKESNALEIELKNYTSSQTWGGGKLGWPVIGRITSEFGYRIRPNFGYRHLHSGIDIAVPSGTPIHAAGDGVVYSAGWKGSYGNAVIIDHGSGLMTLYAHNSSLAVSAGQSVKRGDVIAYAGSTGNSTGPHCHFEVRVNGTPQNPRGWL